MRELIGNMVYDTNNAELIHTLTIDKHKQISHSLYVTKKGNYFSLSIGLLYDHIEPLTNGAAATWMYRCCGRDAVEDRFPGHIIDA